MKNNTTVSLLGCGWLGYPLAKYLISKEFRVKASTTSPAKSDLFKSDGIDPYLVQFDINSQDPELFDFLDSDILIISVPPGRRSITGTENYRKMAFLLKPLLERGRISRIIFISSTSVYPESNSEITESSAIAPETDSAKAIAEFEEMLNGLKTKVVVLRLAGLIGPGRTPGRFFAGKTNIPNGLAPVNLIHLDDVIALVSTLINDENAGGIYNGCAPIHPSKEEFYTLAAKTEHLVEPQFIAERKDWKVISTERTDRELNFTYKYASLMDWLKNL
ncbi:SDR family oxidoreductase [Daejeonella sp. H1SJ63]|uniref:SDR family oxidoreductase n=1 Tax=Daejeonella sp. H1SJ63 TaxID=3034145 RepID=UPI0023EC1580|nr:SDR family oxidoreductase [Daejeonella sp. H1SJ63]